MQYLEGHQQYDKAITPKKIVSTKLTRLMLVFQFPTGNKNKSKVLINSMRNKSILQCL
jgi:hypothetical protein